MNTKILDPFSTSPKKVLLTEADKKEKIKIYCREDYAQSLYDLISGRNGSTASKDLLIDHVYKVRALSFSLKDQCILTEDIESGTNILVPFKEYSKPLDQLFHNANLEFFVNLYYAKAGEFIGSEKKATSVSYKHQLFEHLKNETWFDVKIKKLIKGGYLAIYQNEIECFIPGSHAAANIIHNFSDLLGKTITVMVDNYDESNNLFILSYKKYITHSLPTLISDIKFDTPYLGVLTSNPYDFGMFVEIDGYYTGMIHKTEFDDYEKARKSYRIGDKIEVYVKDVISKAKQYRIVLTLDKSQVNEEKKRWQELRNSSEQNTFKYTLDQKNSIISIDINGTYYTVQLSKNDIKKNLSNYPNVTIYKVDPINKVLNFEFTK